MAVLGAHSYSNVSMNNPWLCWLWGRFCNNGNYGVYLFFVVSGFLITNAIHNNPGGLKNPSAVRFYVQRIGRIWPLFFVCLGAGIIIYLFMPSGSDLYNDYFPIGGDFGFWFCIPTFMFNWFMTFSTAFYSNHWLLLWSLSVEEQFYFLYPLGLKKLKGGGYFYFC
jgi:peptidoglycan/LPS O-acetylase OafA/YrhL